MNTLKISKKEWAMLAVAFLFISWIIFRMIDDRLPVRKILSWEYAAPISIYSVVVILIAFGFYKFFGAIFKTPAFIKVFAFVFGGMVGLKALWLFTNWIFR